MFPTVEGVPVQQIKAKTLVEALELIKARGALETVRRLVQGVNEIMIYAVKTGLIYVNPASGIGIGIGIGIAFEKPKYADVKSRRTAKFNAIFGYVKFIFNNPLPNRMATLNSRTPC